MIIDAELGCLPAWLIIPAAIFEILDWYIYISIIEFSPTKQN